MTVSSLNLLSSIFKSSIFASIDEAALNSLAARLEIITLSEGERLVAERDDSLYILVSGGLRLPVLQIGEPSSNSGTQIEPGQIVGGRAEAYAIGDTVVARLSPATLTELSQDHPDAVERLAHAAAERSGKLKLCHMLQLTEIFGVIDDLVLEDLLAELEHVSLSGGDILFRQGDEGDALYVITGGRLRVVRETAGSEPLPVAEIASGETVGEMALLNGEKRSATVYALRDSHLARLSLKSFERLLEKHPLPITRIIAGRLASRLQEQTERGVGRGRTISTIAVLAVRPDVPLLDFSVRFSQALSQLGGTLRVTSQMVDHALEKPKISQATREERDNLRIVEWLARQETEFRFTVYQADPSFTEWTRRCLRQADHILLVADARGDPRPDAIEHELLRISNPKTDIPKSLVLLHPDSSRRPTGTHLWLEPRRVDRHHHVRCGAAGDYERLARLLTGRAFGLTLGGGFARGLAHIGVFRALDEIGIPIDAVGGSSMGALIAAQWALGWDYDEIIRRTRQACTESFNDRTLPFVAFHRGGKFSRAVDKLTADIQIEDLWTPFFCVSANLNRAELKVHSDRSLTKALLATTRAPGVFPPIVYDGELHIDGGMLNNVPVDVMRTFSNGGIVMGVDVSPPHELNSITDYGNEIGGWEAIWRRFNPFAKSVTYVPSILLVLMRTLEFSGVSLKEVLSRDSDLFLRPPLLGFKRTDFHAADQIAEIGYKHCLEKMGEWLAQRSPDDPRRPFMRPQPGERT